MTRGVFLSKFKLDSKTLVDAVEEKIDLEYDHPDLYQKVYQFYKDQDVYFYDDKDKDYNIILESLEYDVTRKQVSTLQNFAKNTTDRVRDELVNGALGLLAELAQGRWGHPLSWWKCRQDGWKSNDTFYLETVSMLP